jgi:hypothetical protein
LASEPPPREDASNVVTLPQVTHLPAKAEKPRADKDASSQPPPPGNDGIDPVDGGAIHPSAVLAKSKQLQEELDKENPKLARRSGRWSETPPSDHNDEV